MQRVFTIIREERRRIASHPFFNWLNNAEGPLIDRFAFSPVLADFIMGFADLNKWFIKYENPTSMLELSLNEHASEDQTHSRLFIGEWRKLGLDQTLGWSASDTLWWWFWCRETEVIRHAAMETLGIAERSHDPLVRFAMVEAIENCGDVFFENTCPIAVALEQETGLRYDYYGVYHREREDGHLRSDEDEFLEAQLDPEQFEHARRAVSRIFDLFVGELDQLLDYVLRVSRDFDAVVAEQAQERATQCAPVEHSASTVPVRFSRREDIPNITQRAVHQRLQERLDRLHEHGFIQWLRSWSVSGPQPGQQAVELLQAFTPLWAIDVLGYKDFNECILRFEEPATAEERAINRWTELLASHGILYLQDWEALGIDQQLGWGAEVTIEHYFLGEHSEVHRHAMSRTKKRAFASDSARLRYWLLRALEEGGQVFFGALQSIATAAERELGVPLNYWSERHHLVHPKLAADPEAEGVSFCGLSLSAQERVSAIETIDVIFDNLERQFALSMRVVGCQPLRTRSRMRTITTLERIGFAG